MVTSMVEVTGYQTRSKCLPRPSAILACQSFLLLCSLANHARSIAKDLSANHVRAPTSKYGSIRAQSLHSSDAARRCEVSIASRPQEMISGMKTVCVSQGILQER